MLITILKKNHGSFMKRLEKWNSNCDKYNIEHTAEYQGDATTANGLYSIATESWEINFTLPSTSLEYVGNIKYIDGKPFVFRTGYINPLDYAKGPIDVCQHCGATRERNCYYYFHNIITDEVIKVGSTCVHAYIGFDLNSLSSFVEDCAAFDENNLPAVSNRYDMNTFLTILTASSKNYVKQYSKESTMRDYEAYKKCYGKTAIDMYSFDFNKLNELNSVVIPEDLEKRVYDYWSAQYGDFANNVKSVLFRKDSNRFAESFRVNFIKIAVCGILKAMAPKENNLATGDYIGEIKDRVEVTAKVEDVKVYDSAYGDVAYIHLLTKEDNKLLVKTNTTTSFYSKAINSQTEYITFKGTVSKHDIKLGIKITVLQRCK